MVTSVRILLVGFWISGFVLSVGAAPGDITTVAGGGVGDGRPATNAGLNVPSRPFLDAAGNLYIADTFNHRIRKVDRSGTITTVAGNGSAGFSGDGGPATRASLNRPFGVFVDESGNLYIADTDNHRIRKVDASGIITTVAGTLFFGFSGDGGPATRASLNSPNGVSADMAGNLYIAEFENHRIRKVDTSGTITTVAGDGTAAYFGDGGPATDASLGFPFDVFVDMSGNLYIADTGNNRVRKVDTSGTITTVAGNGTHTYFGDGGSATDASLAFPYGVFVDRSGNLYIADTFNNRIRKVDPSGTITTVAGSGDSFSPLADIGRAITFNLWAPRGIFGDGSGNLYIADTFNHRIRKVGPGGDISTVAGGGFVGDGSPATHAGLFGPQGIFVDGSGNLYIADRGNNRIRKIDGTGTITTVAGNGRIRFRGDGGPATSGRVWEPGGVFGDRSGNLYIADTFNDRIRKVDPSGTITTVAGNGNPTFSSEGGPAIGASLFGPSSVFVDRSGNLYIADTFNHRIRKVHPSGAITIITTVAGNGTRGFSGDGGPAIRASLTFPFDVFVDGLGILYIADKDNHRVRKVDASGTITTVAGNGIPSFSGDGGPATRASLVAPNSLFVDGSGNLFIADRGNNRIRRVEGIAAPPNLVVGVFEPPALVSSLPGLGPASPGVGPTLSGPLPILGPGLNDPQEAGTIRTIAGGDVGDGRGALEANLLFPNDVVTDQEGNLYISSGSNNRVRRVDALTGLISTVAGTGIRGFSGDGGSAVDAKLAFNVGLAIDSASNLFLADAANHRIRRVDAQTSIITTVAGTGEPGFSGDEGPAVNAQLLFPEDIAVDRAGNLFIADRSNHRVRMVDSSTGQIVTVAGNGAPGFAGDGGHALAAQIEVPERIAVDNSGNLYVSTGSRIRRIDAKTGTVTTVAGTTTGFSGDGGPATEAQFSDSQRIAIDAQGNIFVADQGNHRIRKVDAQSGIVTTLVGTGKLGFSGDGGPAAQAQLFFPEAVALDNKGSLLIADQGNSRIRKVVLRTNTITTGAGGGVGDGRPALQAQLGFPRHIVLDDLGNLYIADRSHNRIRRVDAKTGLISTIAGTGIRGSTGDGGPATSALIAFPFGLAVDRAGNLFISDFENDRIRKTDLKTGIIATVAGADTAGFSGDGGQAVQAQLDDPLGLALDSAGNLFFADAENHRVRRVDTKTGVITTIAGTDTEGLSGDGGPATAAALLHPRDVAVDAADNLFIADTFNDRIRKVDLKTGIITTVAGADTAGFSGDGGPAVEATLSFPSSIALDAKSNLFIGDLGNDRIRKVDASTGIISTVAGSGTRGFSGDGGPATKAAFLGLWGVAITPSGDLLISDATNHRIRRVAGIAAPTTHGDAVVKTSDFNGDGTVNFEDFLEFAQNFSKNQSDPDFDATYDLNDDGEVNFMDFFQFAQAFGQA